MDGSQAAQKGSACEIQGNRRVLEALGYRLQDQPREYFCCGSSATPWRRPCGTWGFGCRKERLPLE